MAQKNNIYITKYANNFVRFIFCDK